MIESAEPAELDWLLGSDAARWLDEVAAADGCDLATLAALRKSLSPSRAALIVEQAQLRRKAHDKFASARRMFFTPIGLAQATDDAVAAYKARRFSGRSVVDLCCGIGGDLAALAALGAAVGVEQHPVTARLAQVNAAARVLVQSAESTDLSACDAWHIDPDRRATAARSTKIELAEPSPEVIEAMRQRSSNGAVKLAPAAEVPPTWADGAVREWITHRRECRQQVVWWGDLAEQPGLHRATRIDRDGRAHHYDGRPNLPANVAESIRRYVIDPDPSVIAAGLVGDVAGRHQLSAVAPRSAWLTGDSPPRDELLAVYEVHDVLPYDVRRLRRHARERNWGQLEIKVRGVKLDPEDVRGQLKTSGDVAVTLMVARVAGRVTVVVARPDAKRTSS
jgi:hypothetical protein